MNETVKSVAIIGGGPAGLIAAEKLSARGLKVTVYERKPSLGRKFLMAGRGGLNITHSEEMESFLTRYRGDTEAIIKSVCDFPPEALRRWCEELGQETFIGSSGRIFPKALKASPLLRAWIARLNDQGVEFKMQRRWAGWDNSGRLEFQTADGGKEYVFPDAVLLALGGASWPSLGSDGNWDKLLKGRDVQIRPFKPSNCGFHAAWSSLFKDKFAGQPLKSISLSCGTMSVAGEMMMDEKGIEGGAVYALSAFIRETIEKDGAALLHIDLRPDMPVGVIKDRLSRVPRGRKSFSTYLQKSLSLSPLSISLLREADKDIAARDIEQLARFIKSIPIEVTAAFDIDRAISTAGGVPFSELDGRFMLKKAPGVFCAGEMLDWEAPTGGYLLQACFATGITAAKGLTEWLFKEADKNA